MQKQRDDNRKREMLDRKKRDIYSRTGKVKERGKGDTRRKMRLKEGRGGKKKGKDREIG